MPHKLLVVDDANVHRVILCRMAEKEGFEAIGAASVEEAGVLLASHTFDCITLDLSLADRTGVEVLKLLSERGIRAPVIIISGSEDSVLTETIKIGNAMGLTIRPSISKPVDLALLRGELAKIGKQIDLQRLARAPA